MKKPEKELIFSIEKSFELFWLLLVLLDDVTLHAQKIADIRKEKKFANEIYKTLRNPNLDLESASEVQPYGFRKGKGSTDVGDVSWMVPTARLRVATWVPGTSAHTWQAVSAGGMSIGMKGMVNAAKVIAGTAFDLYNDPEAIKNAKKELIERRGPKFNYYSLLGERNPPLDYRK